MCLILAVAFFISTYFVKRASQRRASIRSSGQHTISNGIILKIAFITGLPKMIAFTAVFIPPGSRSKHIGEILYSIIYGLQGAFVVASFLSAKQVRFSVSNSFSNRKRSITQESHDKDIELK